MVIFVANVVPKSFDLDFLSFYLFHFLLFNFLFFFVFLCSYAFILYFIKIEYFYLIWMNDLDD